MYRELLQLNNSNYTYYYQILEVHGFPLKKDITERYSEEEQ